MKRFNQCNSQQISTETKKYNYRQIKLMEKKIALFKENKITGTPFALELRTLLLCIQNSEKQWVSACMKHCCNIDRIYDMACYENRLQLNSEEQTQIDDAIVYIEQLIAQYKQENFTEDDIIQFEYIDK